MCINCLFAILVSASPVVRLFWPRRLGVFHPSKTTLRWFTTSLTALFGWILLAFKTISGLASLMTSFSDFLTFELFLEFLELLQLFLELLELFLELLEFLVFSSNCFISFLKSFNNVPLKWPTEIVAKLQNEFYSTFYFLLSQKKWKDLAMRNE